MRTYDYLHTFSSAAKETTFQYTFHALSAEDSFVAYPRETESNFGTCCCLEAIDTVHFPFS